MQATGWTIEQLDFDSWQVQGIFISLLDMVHFISLSLPAFFKMGTGNCFFGSKAYF
jgi:hypothetical protein